MSKTKWKEVKSQGDCPSCEKGYVVKTWVPVMGGAGVNRERGRYAYVCAFCYKEFTK